MPSPQNTANTDVIPMTKGIINTLIAYARQGEMNFVTGVKFNGAENTYTVTVGSLNAPDETATLNADGTPAAPTS